MMRLTWFLLCLFVSTAAQASDWPQWMGPQRDNVWRAQGVINAFPESGLDVVWRAPLAGGYSGPAVAGDRVVATDYVTEDNVKVDNFNRQEYTGTERIVCWRRSDGSPQWVHEYPVSYSISYPAGPRCTPIIHDGRVYTLGAEGNLCCLDLETGELLWSHDLKQEYQTKAALWGYASHPLIDGNRLICLVGGEGTHAVAFDLESGDELWRSGTAPEQGYSPPLIIDEGGVRQLIITRPDAVTSLSPETGSLYWSVPYEATNGSIIMTPIHWNHHLYVGGYSNKNLLIQLSQTEPTASVVWQDENRAGISPVNVQPFLEGNVLYGFDQSGELMAVELPSGKRLWTTPQPLADRRLQTGTAFLVKHEDRFWMFTEQGDLLIARLTPQGFEELDRCHVIAPTNNAFGRDVVWSAPAFADTQIFIRNDREIICLDAAQTK